MNKFAAIFLILFFITMIAVAGVALNEQVLLKGEANQLCPVPTFPENPQCPPGQEMDLIEDTNKCLVFQCK